MNQISLFDAFWYVDDDDLSIKCSACNHPHKCYVGLLHYLNECPYCHAPMYGFVRAHFPERNFVRYVV